ncbi:proton-coupled amino acid transporter-like protein pathetic [Neocloeon triangulifer]|uniref:proton-coupled amino acid transporter-like protein pathetic n=1 Tax=Neocloeon triangulifer TaxID=2078957 RepID=UPI00286EC1B4|nr:proton-coupled amino acid transporter-like protein pathetic [Neocloeon triangulifer]
MSTDKIMAEYNVKVVVTKKNQRNANESPFLKREVAHPTSDIETLIHLAKGSLGTGVLAMPFAFSNAGLALGLIGTIFIGFVCTHCVHIMVKSAQELCWRHNIPALDFGDIAETAFKNGPQSLRPASGFARGFIQTLIVVVALGACCVYIVFVSSNLQQVIDFFTGTTIDIKLYILMVTAVLMALAMIRNLRLLSPFSLLSNVLFLASIGIVFYYVFQDLPSVNEREAFMSITKLPVFFSTAVFALEGITVVMPLENNMKTPQHFTGCFRVLNTAMAMIVSIYALVGFMGYLKYGDEVEGSISLNLPEGEIPAQTAQIMLAAAVAFTYPLQFYCAMEFTWPSLDKFLQRKVPKISGLLGEYIYRVLLVLLTMAIALAIPNLSALMGLIGAVCLSTVGLMFPAIVETIVYWEDWGWGNWKLVKNILIFLFGLLGFVTGLYTSILDLIASFGGGEEKALLLL